MSLCDDVDLAFKKCNELNPYYGERKGQLPRVHDIQKPLPTQPTKYFGTAIAQSVNEPLDTVTTKDRFALVIPELDGFALDIRFRMLQPHELAAAMSFPKEYQFAGNRENRVKQIGNAVPVNLARALCMGLLADKAKVHDSTKMVEAAAC